MLVGRAVGGGGERTQRLPDLSGCSGIPRRYHRTASPSDTGQSCYLPEAIAKKYSHVT